jgi:hypothetical protein
MSNRLRNTGIALVAAVLGVSSMLDTQSNEKSETSIAQIAPEIKAKREATSKRVTKNLDSRTAQDIAEDDFKPIAQEIAESLKLRGYKTYLKTTDKGYAFVDFKISGYVFRLVLPNVENLQEAKYNVKLLILDPIIDEKQAAGIPKKDGQQYFKLVYSVQLATDDILDLTEQIIEASQDALIATYNP